MEIPTYDDMLAAHERINPHIRRTPVRTSDYLNELTGAQLFFKCENFQEPGAFKVRGATNAVFVRGALGGDALLSGPGAGGAPTALSVLGDIIDVTRNLDCAGQRRSPARDIPQKPCPVLRTN